MKTLRMLATVVVLLCGLTPLAVPAAEPIQLKFGHDGAPGSLFAASSEEFARRANARLGDKARVIVSCSSQHGDDTEVLQKVKIGTVDFAIPSTIMSIVSPFPAPAHRA